MRKAHRPCGRVVGKRGWRGNLPSSIPLLFPGFHRGLWRAPPLSGRRRNVRIDPEAPGTSAAVGARCVEKLNGAHFPSQRRRGDSLSGAGHYGELRNGIAGAHTVVFRLIIVDARRDRRHHAQAHGGGRHYLYFPQDCHLSFSSGAWSMRSRNWSSFGVMIISVRRLRWRPSSESLLAMGLYSPRPAAVILLGSMPKSFWST